MNAVLVAAAVSLPLAGRPLAAGAAPDSLTVRQCIARTLQAASDVKAAREGADAAAYQLDAANSNARPALQLHSSAWVVPDDFYDPAATNEGEYDLRLVGTMHLLDGGGRKRERSRARAEGELARVDLAATQREVEREAAELGVGILESSAGIRRLGEAEQWTTEVLRTLRAEARVGARSPSDVARLELDLRSISTDRADREVRRQEQGRALALLLFPDSAGAAFTGVRDSAWSEVPPTSADSAALIERFDRSSDVARAAQRVEIAVLGVATARGAKALQLDAMLDAGLLGTDLHHLEPPDPTASTSSSALLDRLRADLGASFKLELALPLVSPGSGSTVAAREAELRAAQIQLAAARRVARRAAFDLLARWSAAAARLVVHRESAELAEAHARRAHSLYLSGAGSMLELLDARRVWSDARERLEGARAELQLAQLEAEIGL